MEIAMQIEQLNSGLIIPKRKPEPTPPPERPKIIPKVDSPIGWNDDGSLTLCPEVVRVLNRCMLERGSQFRLPDGEARQMERLADAIYEHQGIGFEQYA